MKKNISQENFIKENYPKHGNKYCSEKLNISSSQVSRYAKNLKLKRFRHLDIQYENNMFKCMGKCAKILNRDNFTQTCFNTDIFVCKKCKSDMQIEREKRIKSTQEGKREWTIKKLLSCVKSRVKKENIPFDLDHGWINQNLPKICPIFKTEIILGNNLENRNNSPSIDKIVPNIGYIKSNCRIISYKANLLKSDGTAEEHEKIANYIKNNT